jgi:hypothetical protein
MLTLGRPVVWLSSGPNDWSGNKDAHRLTVQLGANSRRLANHLTWMRQQNHQFLLKALAEPEFKLPIAPRNYIYFGAISLGLTEGLKARDLCVPDTGLALMADVFSPP